MKLKQTTGWFAATHQMRQALGLLSDGAFKLFVYLSLSADRCTGRLQVAQTTLARALGKSRTSISAYLEELSGQGFCLLKPAANQHQAGEIEIADAFWPYEKQAAGDDRETTYLEQVRLWLADYPIIRSSFAAAERRAVAELFHQGVSLQQLERAFILGLTRKYLSCLNATALSPIYSFSYFLPLLAEVAQTEVSDRYWDYLRRRLKQLNATWLERSCSVERPPAGGNTATPAATPRRALAQTASRDSPGDCSCGDGSACSRSAPCLFKLCAGTWPNERKNRKTR